MQGADDHLCSIKELSSKGRGSSCVATSSDKITVTRWIDNKSVHMISTFAGKDPMDLLNATTIKKKSIHIPRSYSISVYNKFMGGVDMSDRMVAHYPHAIKKKKVLSENFFPPAQCHHCKCLGGV